MAELTIEQLKQKNKELEDKLSGLTKQIQDSARSVSDFVNNAASNIQQIVKKTSNFVDSMKIGFKEIEKNTNISSLSLNKFSQDVINVGKVVNILGMTLSSSKTFDGFNQNITNSVITINTQVDELKSNVNSLVNTFSAAKLELPINSGLLGKGIELIKHLGEVAQGAMSSGQNLENGFLSMAATSGNLGEVFAKAGNDLSGLDNYTRQYYYNISNAGAATGRTLTQTMEFAKGLSGLPDLFNSSISGIKGFNNNTQLLTMAMTAAAGTMQSNEKVAQFMKRGFEDLSKTQGKLSNEEAYKKGLEMLALTSRAANELKMPFEQAEQYMNATAEAFKDIGDNTEASVHTLNRFYDSLRNTGLTGKQTISIIQGMQEGIAKLTSTANIGSRALMSFRTGGPGGLQGAFQIENMLRQGKSDEVLQMAMKSLKQQFGGRIRSVEEAGRSQEGASEFLRQRSMLMSGAFGGLVKNEDQANRLMEAMSKGEIGKDTLEKIKGVDALGKVAEQGNAIQERSFTELQKMNIQAQQIAAYSAISAYSTARIALAGKDTKDFFKSFNELGKSTEGSGVNEELAKGIQAGWFGGIVNSFKNLSAVKLEGMEKEEGPELPETVRNRPKEIAMHGMATSTTTKARVAQQNNQDNTQIIKHEFIITLKDTSGNIVAVIGSDNSGVSTVKSAL